MLHSIRNIMSRWKNSTYNPTLGEPKAHDYNLKLYSCWVMNMRHWPTTYAKGRQCISLAPAIKLLSHKSNLWHIKSWYSRRSLCIAMNFLFTPSYMNQPFWSISHIYKCCYVGYHSVPNLLVRWPQLKLVIISYPFYDMENQALQPCPSTVCMVTCARYFGIRGLGKTLTVGLGTAAARKFCSAKERSHSRRKYN